MAKQTVKKESPQAPYQETDYADPNVQSGYKERPETYKGAKGRTDIVRLVTNPLAYYGGRIENKADPEKSFFMTSRVNPADFESGDVEAMKAACPLVRHGVKLGRRFVSGILWIKSVDARGRETERNMFIPWCYGPDKYTQLRDIERSFAANPVKLSNGTTRPRTLLDVELQLTIVEPKYSKMNIVPIIPPSMKKSEVWDAVSEFFEGDEPKASECPLVREAIEPDSVEQMEASILRAEGRGGVEDDEDVVEGDTAPKKGAAKKPGAAVSKKQPTSDEADDMADLEDALGEDEAPEPKATTKKAATKKAPVVEEDAEEEVVDDEVVDEAEEEEAPKPVTKKRSAAAASVPAKKTVVKKSAPVVEEEEVVEEE